jgi:hypothetical protein
LYPRTGSGRAAFAESEGAIAVAALWALIETAVRLLSTSSVVDFWLTTLPDDAAGGKGEAVREVGAETDEDNEKEEEEEEEVASLSEAVLFETGVRVLDRERRSRVWFILSTLVARYA